jgi:hypothetical protein
MDRDGATPNKNKSETDVIKLQVKEVLQSLREIDRITDQLMARREMTS